MYHNDISMYMLLLPWKCHRWYPTDQRKHRALKGPVWNNHGNQRKRTTVNNSVHTNLARYWCGTHKHSQHVRKSC